jgi:hypothetical protein
MTEQETIDAYIKLFRGRGDAVGTWEGGSVRRTIDADDFKNHLTSSEPFNWIGVYPHLGDRGVSWGCIDVDGKDFPRVIDDPACGHDWERMHTLANNIKSVLAHKSVYAHIEQTRNGYHLWVFPEDGIVPARYMRRALMAACKACKYDPKEVNPKQEELAAGKLGNYVRLPYYGHLHEGVNALDRYFLDDAGHRMGLKPFLQAVKLTTTAALEAVAELWTPPVVATFDGPPPEDVAPIIEMLGGLTYTVWKDGPLEGRDRSNTLAKLSYLLRDDAMPMPHAFAVVKDADARWGKFAGRTDCDEQIMSIVQRAYFG